MRQRVFGHGPGDNFLIDWVPGTGSVITLKGQGPGEPFKEPELFKALIMIWLGQAAADYKLKEALLGVKQAKSGSTPPNLTRSMLIGAQTHRLGPTCTQILLNQ